MIIISTYFISMAVAFFVMVVFLFIAEDLEFHEILAISILVSFIWPIALVIFLRDIFQDSRTDRDDYKAFITPYHWSKKLDDRSARRAYKVFKNEDRFILSSYKCTSCERILTPDCELDTNCPACSAGQSVVRHGIWGRHAPYESLTNVRDFADRTMREFERTVNGSSMTVLLYWIPREATPSTHETYNDLSYWLDVAVQAESESVISVSVLRDIVMSLRACGKKDISKDILEKIQKGA